MLQKKNIIKNFCQDTFKYFSVSTILKYDLRNSSIVFQVVSLRIVVWRNIVSYFTYRCCSHHFVILSRNVLSINKFLNRHGLSRFAKLFTNHYSSRRVKVLNSVWSSKSKIDFDFILCVYIFNNIWNIVGICWIKTQMEAFNSNNRTSCRY